MKSKASGKHFDFVQAVLDLLDGWKRLTDAMERVLVGNIAATVPWLASTLPAWMAYDNMVRVLHIWEPVAFVGGLTVEGLGIATVNTAVKFWQYNRERMLVAQMNRKASTVRKGKKPAQSKPVRGLAPFWTAVSMAAFYFFVVIVLNVVLDPADGWHKTGKALLSLLSPVGAMTIALNAEFSNLLHKAAERKTRRVAGVSPGGGNGSGETPEKAPEQAETPGEQGPVYRSWHEVPESEWQWLADASASEIVTRYRLTGKDPARAARELRKNARSKIGGEQ